MGLIIIILGVGPFMNKKRLVPPKTLTGNIYTQNQIILCSKCDGLGFVEIETSYDYHKRESSTSRTSCNNCHGDGRMIKTTESIEVNVPRDNVSLIPYIKVKDVIDPHESLSIWTRWRLDNTDINLENKYPELAAISYDKYDEMVEKYRLIELLKKEEQNG
jgi:hypothetical protein